MNIHNCHIHTFTADHVPNRFLPLKFQAALRSGVFRRPLLWLIRAGNPFKGRDALERLANFVKISSRKTQREIFDHVRYYYPPETRFVILPMDMEFMSAGKPRKSVVEQHDELAELRKAFPDVIIPFVAADPRRSNVLEFVKGYVEKHEFKGIKIYPPLGYWPTDPKLMEVYAYAEEKDLPVMTHTSRGGVYDRRKPSGDMLRHPDTGEQLVKDKPERFTEYYTDPDNYIPILEKYPRLKLCLAHFGGGDDWQDYLDDAWDPKDSAKDKSWLSKIRAMIKDGKYKNLYTDISYTVFNVRDYLPLLKILLEDQAILDRTLFGSDYYMAEREAVSERAMSIKLRSVLGEQIFWKIAEDNPKRYLSDPAVS